jgi:hypothetical protein
MKHRSLNGCRVVGQTTARSVAADVVAALREYADRLDQESSSAAQDAA